MAEIVIYVLRDPRTNDVRYVGQTAHKSTRWYEHLRYPAGTAKRKWVLELRGLGLQPVFDILEQVTEENRDEREAFWVAHYEPTELLLNAYPGGLRNANYATVAKKLRGQKRDPEIARKIWETRRKNGTDKQPEAGKEKIREANRVQFLDPEKRARHAEAVKGWRETPQGKLTLAKGGKAAAGKLREWWEQATLEEKKKAQMKPSRQWKLSPEQVSELQGSRTRGKILGPRPKMSEAMKRVWQERKAGLR